MKNIIKGVFFIFGCLLLTSCASSPIVLKEKDITVEYGKTLSLQLEDYVDTEKSDEEALSKAKLDFSELQIEENKDYPKIGDYKLYILCDEDKYEINVTIKDTEAPVFIDFKEELSFPKDVVPTSEEIIKNYTAEDMTQVQITVDDSQVDYTKIGEYKAIVKATDTSNNETEKEIRIKVVEPTITLEKENETISVGSSITLKAKVSGKEKNIVYKSSDEKIATVDSQGKVIGKTKGKAIITLTAIGVETKCTVTVKQSETNIYKELLAKGKYSNIRINTDCLFSIIDLNDDGIKELIVADYGERVAIYSISGDNLYRVHVEFPSGSNDGPFGGFEDLLLLKDKRLYLVEHVGSDMQYIYIYIKI